MFDFGAGPRGAARSAACCSPGSRRTWSGRCRSSTRCTTRLGAARTSAPGCCSTTRMAMAGKYDMGVPRHQHLFRRQRRPDRPRPAHRRPRRRDPLLRLPGRRRPAGDDGRPHRRHPRRPRRHPDQGHRLPARGRAGRRRPRRATSRPARELEVRARVVVNAAGVWTDEIQEMVGGRGALDVQASKGIHLVVPRDRIRSEAGFITKTEKSVLFVIPWGRHWIIGTTDTAWDLDKAHPAASRADIDYLLDHVNPLLTRAARPRRRRGRVRRAAAAARRRVASRPRKLSREHTVVTPGARPGADRRRQAHDVPRDGASDAVDAAAHSLRPRRRRAALDHRPGAAGRRRGLRGPHQPAGRAGAGVRAARRRGSTTCSAGTAAWSTSCST